MTPTEFQQISEAKVDFLRAQFVEKTKAMDEQEFFGCCATDPTSDVVPDDVVGNRTSTGEVRRAGKYTEWVIRNYLKLQGPSKKRFWDDSDWMKTWTDLQLFDRYKDKLDIGPSKDIGTIRGFTELWNVANQMRRDIPNLPVPESPEAKKVTKILDTPEWLVLIPHTIEASRKYGKGTRWCTASENDHYFNSYTDEGPLFIIIYKPDDEKHQFHYESSSFMDAGDDPVDAVAWFAEHREVAQAIRRYMDPNDCFHDKNPSERIRFLYMLGTVVEAFEYCQDHNPPINPLFLPVVAVAREFNGPGDATNRLRSADGIAFLNTWDRDIKFDETGITFLRSDLDDLFKHHGNRQRALEVFTYGDLGIDPDGSISVSHLLSYTTPKQDAKLEQIVVDSLSPEEGHTDWHEDGTFCGDWHDYVNDCEEVIDMLGRAGDDAVIEGTHASIRQAYAAALDDIEVATVHEIVWGDNAAWMRVTYRSIMRHHELVLDSPFILNDDNHDDEQLTLAKIEQCVPDGTLTTDGGDSEFDVEYFRSQLDEALGITAEEVVVPPPATECVTPHQFVGLL